ncbi:MAG: ABC transporter substrate-binding protein [Actinomycetia bacterium]|nr:ABC transporter substrate-binding protein [Actinomycetes bacterium]
MTQRFRARKISSLVAAAALLLVSLGAATACSSSGKSPSSTTQAGAQSTGGTSPLYDADLAAQVPEDLRNKTLDIGTYNNYPPENYVENGKLVGFDVEIANAVADTLGLKFNLVPGAFSILIPGIQDGRFAATFSSVNPTDERLKTIDVVVFHNSLTGFVTKISNNMTIATADDVCGITVGVAAGTNEETTLQQLSADECVAKGKKAVGITTYPDTPTGVLAVTNGRVDAFSETVIGLMQVVTQSNGALTLQPYEYNPKPAGAAFPKNSPLVQPVADAINKLIENGTYGQIMKKWDVEQAMVEQSEVRR